MTQRVRRATAGDAAALSLVASASFLETFAGILSGDDIVAHCAANNSPAAFVRWASDPAGAVTIAEAEPGHAPIGYIVLTKPDLPVEPGPADIELKRIYALAQTHGTGLGAALMASAVAEARALGRSRVLLGVYRGNARARAFYERQGFVPVGERRFLVGSTWHDDLVYARTL